MMENPEDNHAEDPAAGSLSLVSTRSPSVAYNEEISALHEHIQQMDYVYLNDFIRDILPQSYVARFPDLDLVINQLETDRALDDDGYWTDLPWGISDAEKPEVECHACIATIIAAVSKAATTVANDSGEADGAPTHLEYVDDGDKNIPLGHRHDTSRPDSFFALKNRFEAATALEAVPWWDIAVIAEFKSVRDLDGIVDSTNKMLWGLRHLMHNDVRRNFAYGFTVEDTSAKLWYCDRSNIVTSDRFDLHQDHREFITFCLAVLYASTDELGWDASMTRLSPMKDATKKQPGTGTAATNLDQTATPEGAHPRYIIDVRVDEQVTRKSVTISPLSMSGASGILGRGTRVWEARELLDDGKESDKVVAIKDYWVEADRNREGDVVQSILDVAPDEACRVMLKDHIIDILCHGDVYRKHTSIFKRDGQRSEAVNETVPTSTRDLKAAIARKIFAISLRRPHGKPWQSDQSSGAQIPVSASSYFDVPVVWQRRPLLSVRCRNRLVMRQVGKPLHREQSLRAIFSALHDVCTGLELIHYYGWMHRDISTGNILIWEGKGILTDFEYAERIPPKGSVSTTSHEGRAGTPYFMAAEVQTGRYLFRPLITGRKAPLAIDRPITGPKKPPPIPRRRTRPVASSQPPAPQTTPVVDTDCESLKRKRSRVSDTADGAVLEAFPGQASLASCQVESAALEQYQPLSGQQSRDTSPAPIYVSFAYDPAHDFETLIWIGNYFIFNRRVVEHSQQQPQDHLAAQAAYARRLFLGGADEKRAAFDEIHANELTKFEQHVRHLHPALHGIGKQMKLWMETMKAIYILFEEQDCRTIASSESILDLREDIAPFPARIVEILAREDVKVDHL